MMTRTVIREGDGDARHGTANGYANLLCRCAQCRQAWNEYNSPYQTAYRRRLGQRPQRLGRTHGCRATYHTGCRCTECRESENTYQRERRARQKVAS